MIKSKLAKYLTEAAEFFEKELFGNDFVIITLKRKPNYEWAAGRCHHVDDDMYDLFLDVKLSKEECIKTVAHEMTHASQFFYKTLTQGDCFNLMRWRGKCVNIKLVPHEKHPWEIEAFQKEEELSSKFLNHKYKIRDKAKANSLKENLWQKKQAEMSSA